MYSQRMSYGGGDVTSAGVTRGSVLSRIQPRMSRPDPVVMDSGNTTGDVDLPHAGGNPLLVLFGMILGLVLVHFLAKAQDATRLEFFGFSPINVLSIGLISLVAIALVKLMVALWHIPGLTQVAAIV